MTQQPAKGFGRRKKNPDGEGAANPRSPDDKREIDRAPSFRNGHIILKDEAMLDCIARDISADGCKVSLSGAENLPEKVMISLGPGSPPRWAKVIWREFDSAGLRFLKAS